MATITLAHSIAATRFGWGAKPGELASIAQDPKSWLRTQVDPGNGSFKLANPMVSTQEYCELIWAGAPSPTMTQLGLTTGTLYDYDMRVRTKFAQTTAGSFRDRLVQFWANHFSVSCKGELGIICDSLEREAIRPHILGKFSDMLLATSRHPQMLNYLENWCSKGPNSPDGIGANGLNENLAREIMELHTLGVDSGYSQADVTSFAKAITGWTYTNRSNGARPYGRFYFEPKFHEPGALKIMGKTYGQSGIDQGTAALMDFARHPATVTRLCTKLATHFHSDTPPQSLINALVSAWTSSDGNLGMVARALIEAPEMWAAPQLKVKSTNDYWISIWRALYPYYSDDWQIMWGYIVMGQPPFSAPSPAGWPDLAEDWGAPGILRQRIQGTINLTSSFQSKISGDIIAFGANILGPRLSDSTRSIMQSSTSRSEQLGILFLSPEFQRR